MQDSLVLLQPSLAFLTDDGTHFDGYLSLAIHAGLLSAATARAAVVEAPQEGLRGTPAGGYGTLHLPGLSAGVGYLTQSGQLGFISLLSTSFFCLDLLLCPFSLLSTAMVSLHSTA